MRIPAEEPDEMELGEAWNVLAEHAVMRSSSHPDRQSLLPAVVERTAEREAETLTVA